MASYNNVKTVTLIAGEDLTGDFGKLLEIASDGEATVVNGLTDVPVAICAEEVDAAGKAFTAVLIAGGGIGMVQAGGTITAGQICIPATDGQVTGVAAITNVGDGVTGIGVALEGASDGDTFRVLLQPITRSNDAA